MEVVVLPKAAVELLVGGVMQIDVVVFMELERRRINARSNLRNLQIQRQNNTTTTTTTTATATT